MAFCCRTVFGFMSGGCQADSDITIICSPLDIIPTLLCLHVPTMSALLIP